jgi:tetratricopeptide (TPR) repeat protein
MYTHPDSDSAPTLSYTKETTPTPQTQTSSSKLERTAFGIFLTSVILTPFVFVPLPFLAFDAIKTIVIALGALIALILYGVIAFKERTITLPPKSVIWGVALVALSLISSSIASGHFTKSFFGQGFELNTTSFLLTLFAAALVTFISVQRKPERATVLSIGITASFIVLFVFHVLRLIFGAQFMSLGVLSNLTSTLGGSWYDLGIYAVVIVFIALSAITFLPLSKRIKGLYWVLFGSGIISAFVVNNNTVWIATSIVMFGLACYVTWLRPRPAGSTVPSFLRRLAWVPVLTFLIAGFITLQGPSFASPVVDKLGTSYGLLSLPWEYSLDITAQTIKTNPLLGAGPNLFSEEYVAHKPIAINYSEAWNTEFNYAFGLFASFVVTQGLLGILAWIILLVVCGTLLSLILKRLPQNPQARFGIVSSASSAVFLWIMCTLSVPSIFLVALAAITTAVALALGVSEMSITSLKLSPRMGTFGYTGLKYASLVCIIIAVLWSISYIRGTAALAYFASGVTALTDRTNPDPTSADLYFSRANMLRKSDVYLQAMAEANLLTANRLIATASPNASASTTEVINKQIVAAVEAARKYAENAITFDSENYYNYVSMARVSIVASKLGVTGGYESVVNSYKKAIELNPLNPTLYSSLGQFEISQNKLDDALNTLGDGFRIKNDYLDIVYLMSQIYTAQGNLRDAIAATQFAIRVNSTSPILHFQLGLLQYNGKEYSSSIESFENAVKIQPEYANARYFLGLAQARVGKTAEAISQFEILKTTNPDNEEVAAILANLIAGKGPFVEPAVSKVTAPEKRSTLPVKERTTKVKNK